MAAGPSVILGGLPVWVELHVQKTYEGDIWEQIDEIRWLKKNGTPGKLITQKVYDKASKYDPGWCELSEHFWDGYNTPSYDMCKLY